MIFGLHFSGLKKFSWERLEESREKWKTIIEGFAQKILIQILAQLLCNFVILGKTLCLFLQSQGRDTCFTKLFCVLNEMMKVKHWVKYNIPHKYKTLSVEDLGK